MADVTVTIHVEDDQLTPAPIDDVVVSVFDSSGDVFVTSGVTGDVTPGVLELLLPGSGGGVTYIVRLYKAGVSFLPSPTKTILATDPAASPDFNDFTFVGTVGIQGSVASFMVVDNDLPLPNPVSDVRLRIFDEADSYLTEMDTDALGAASLVLEGSPDPGTSYIVRVAPPVGYTVEGGPTQTISVIDPLGPGQSNIFDFVAVPPSAVPISSDPQMCRISGYFSDPSLRALKDLSLIFLPREGYPPLVFAGLPFSGEPTMVRDRIITSERRVNADSNGYVELDLPRKSIFDVFVQGLTAPDHTFLGMVWIPDVAGISLEEVLFPYITKVTYAAPAVSVPVGQAVELEVELETSNLQAISGGKTLKTFLEFTTDDDTIAAVSVTDTGTLSIVGKAVGDTGLQVARVAGTVAPRRPEVDDLIILPSIPVITVT